MKRILIVLLSAILLIGLVSCGKNKEPEEIILEEGTAFDLATFTGEKTEYGKLVVAKNEQGTQMLVNSNDSTIIHGKIEEVIGEFDKILIIKTKIETVSYERANLSLFNKDTAEVITTCTTNNDFFEDGSFEKELTRFNGALCIKTDEGYYLINKETFENFNALDFTPVQDGSVIVAEGEDGDILINLETFTIIAKDFTKLDGNQGSWEEDGVEQSGYTDLVSDNIIRVQSNGYWGYIDTDGKTVTDFIFNKAYPFHHGVAPVQYGDNFALINTKGEFIIGPIYNAFDGYADSEYKYMIFDRTHESFSGKELLNSEGKPVIEENKKLMTYGDSYTGIKDYFQKFTDFYVNEEKGIIFAYEFNGYEYRLTTFNLDGTIRYIHPQIYDYGTRGAIVSTDEKEIPKIEETLFKKGPILLYTVGSFSNEYYYLFEDGKITNTYRNGTKFYDNGYAFVTSTTYDSAELGYKSSLINTDGQITHELDYNIDEYFMMKNHFVYKNTKSGMWSILGLKNKNTFGPYSETKLYTFTYEDIEKEFVVIKDGITNLYGIFYNDEVIIDTIYPDIKVEKDAKKITLIEGVNKTVKTYEDLFLSDAEKIENDKENNQEGTGNTNDNTVNDTDKNDKTDENTEITTLPLKPENMNEPTVILWDEKVLEFNKLSFGTASAQIISFPSSQTQDKPFVKRLTTKDELVSLCNKYNDIEQKCTFEIKEYGFAYSGSRGVISSSGYDNIQYYLIYHQNLNATHSVDEGDIYYDKEEKTLYVIVEESDLYKDGYFCENTDYTNAKGSYFFATFHWEEDKIDVEDIKFVLPKTQS